MKVKEESEKVGLKLNIQKQKTKAQHSETWHPVPSFMANRWEIVAEFLFLGSPKSLWMVTAAMKLKDTYSLEGKL